MNTNKKIYFSLYLLCSFFSLYSQSFWEELYFPDTTHIICLETNSMGHIFIGTGHPQNGAGLYRSLDGGISWKIVYNVGSFQVNTIEINEQDHIYVGKTGNNRLIVSKDNGETWNNLDIPPPSTGNILNVLSLVSDTIYLSSWETNGALFTKSYDGGLTWSSNFITDNANEYISDMIISNDQRLLVSLSGFFFNQGGIYESSDYGEKWIFNGLLNHQIRALSTNSFNDLFSCDWWVLDAAETSGIYTLRFENQYFELLFESSNGSDILVTPDNTIFATVNNGIVYSINNGQSFEYIDDILSDYIEIMCLDPFGYLYAARDELLIRSINPVTSITENEVLLINWSIFPNPVVNTLSVQYQSNTDISEEIEVNIWDINAELVLNQQFEIDRNNILIDASTFSPGIFLISLSVDGNSYSKIFIKQ